MWGQLVPAIISFMPPEMPVSLTEAQPLSQCLPAVLCFNPSHWAKLRRVLDIKMDFLLGTFWRASQPLLTFTHLSPEMSSHMEDWGTEFPV